MILRKPLSVLLVLSIIVSGVMSLGVVSAQDATQEITPITPHWSYSDDDGPLHWGELSPDYSLCAIGQTQSPIDLLAAKASNLPDIQFNYNPSGLTIGNNGHTIQVDYDPGSSITIDGKEYALKQFHFHHPSEHTVNGIIYPMELHLVHQDADGNLAVVGVEIQELTQDNGAFAPVWENLLVEPGEPQVIANARINAADFLPENRTYYSYAGSLTTPPCTEGVQWLVLRRPITLSPAQIQEFSDLFPFNARPVQLLGNRQVAADNAADS